MTDVGSEMWLTEAESRSLGDGRAHHISITRDSEGEVRQYIDGVLVRVIYDDGTMIFPREALSSKEIKRLQKSGVICSATTI